MVILKMNYLFLFISLVGRNMSPPVKKWWTQYQYRLLMYKLLFNLSLKIVLLELMTSKLNNATRNSGSARFLKLVIFKKEYDIKKEKSRHICSFTLLNSQ